MVSPSSICTVNNTVISTSNTSGINVSAGSTITIALASSSGVGSWSIFASSADDVTTSNGNLVAVNNSKIQVTPFSATFIVPALVGGRGSSIQFTSIVNNGLSNQNQTTIGVFVLGSGNIRLFFGGESFESNATVGNAADLNSLVAAGASSGFTAGGDLSGTSSSQTVIKIHGTSVPASPSANNVLVATSGTAATWEQISDAQVSSGAAIAGSKITPSFGSQNVSTSGTLSAGGTTVTSLKDSTLSTGIVHSDASGNFTSSLLVNADVSTTAAIAVSKIAAGTASQFLINNTTPSPIWSSVSGDVSYTYSGGTSIPGTVIGLQGNSVANGALGSTQDGYVLTWKNSISEWEALPIGNDDQFVYVYPIDGVSDDWTLLMGTTLPAATAAGKAVVLMPGHQGQSFIANSTTSYQLPNKAIIYGTPNTKIVMGNSFSGNLFSAIAIHSTYTNMTANVAFGDTTIISPISIPFGTRFDLAAAPINNSATYTSLGCTGTGPYTVTLDRPCLWSNFTTANSTQVVLFSSSCDEIIVDGRGMLITTPGPTTGQLIVQTASARDCVFRNMRVDGYSSAQIVGGGFLTDNGTLRCRFENLSYYNCNSSVCPPFFLAGSELCKAINCYASNTSNNSSGAAFLITLSSNCGFYNCTTLISKATTGIAITQSNYCVIDNCISNNCASGSGIDIDFDTHYITISNCTAYNNQSGILCSVNVTPTSSNVVISNCITGNNSSTGIYVATSFLNVEVNNCISNRDAVGCRAYATSNWSNIVVNSSTAFGFYVATFTGSIGAIITLNGFTFTDSQLQMSGSNAFTFYASNGNMICNQADIVVINPIHGTTYLSNVKITGTGVGSALGLYQQGGIVYLESGNNFDACGTPILIGGGANSRGTVVANGTTPVAVPFSALASTDSVVLTLKTLSGVSTPVFPKVTTTPGTGFSITSIVTDTSTYSYSIL